MLIIKYRHLSKKLIKTKAIFYFVSPLEYELSSFVHDIEAKLPLDIWPRAKKELIKKWCVYEKPTAMDTIQTVLLIFCLLSNSVRTKPTSLHIKHINPSQRIQIKFNQTIKYPILINKSPRLTYEENVALFLQNDPDISLQITKLDYTKNNLAHFPNKLLSLVLPN
ncbi:hypothetical protein BpHYR1_020572, partial [Brachionus plicatilis]